MLTYRVLEIRIVGEVREVYVKKSYYEGWNFNSGNYLFTTDTK